MANEPTLGMNKSAALLQQIESGVGFDVLTSAEMATLMGALRMASETERWPEWESAPSTAETRHGWISVAERLPEPYATVLLNCSDELRSTGYLNSEAEFSVDAEDGSDGSHWLVTHWMPLPEAPK